MLIGVTAGLVAALGRADAVPADPIADRRTPVVEVFQQWKDSVVYVTGPMFKIRNPSLEEFFKRPGETPPESSVGSGFVVHESGYIVANAHAAEKVIFPQVALSDGKTYRADLVASIHNEDVALLKIDAARPLKPVRIARSGDLMIGETVVVIANPHGLRHTCTAGIVSAVQRTSKISDIEDLTLRNLIQTDAAINPGSSGGPWFNVLGEVIGLTASKKQNADNIGFAVSAQTLRGLLPDMLDVHRRYGLVTGLTVSKDGPCRVAAVETDSPASDADIRPGDVLTTLSGEPIAAGADWHLGLVGRKPGDTLQLELLRQGNAVEASLTLAPRPVPDAGALLRRKLGLSAVPLSAEKAKTMGLYLPYGVVVTGVDPAIYASVDHRPAPGDVLARVDKMRPRDLDHLGLILEKIEPGQSVTMVLLRQSGKTATRVDIKLALPK